MAIDRVGNSFAKARRLEASNLNFRDALSSKDRVDFFRFVVDQPSNLNLQLSMRRASRQSANADLALFNGDRQILNQSTRRRTQTETIQQTLDPGTYYLRVQRRSGDLRYTLSGSTNPIDPPPNPIAPPPSPINLTSSIQFSQSVYQMTEGETKPLILTRTGSTASTAQVSIAFNGGSLAVTGFPMTLTFNPGETTQEVPIEVFQDAVREDIKTANFQLTSLSANTIADSRTRLQVLDDDRPFNVEFDYRFDTIGWFTPEKKAALEAAADFWENAIQDDFIDTFPGLRVPFIFNPETNARIDDFAINRTVDDLVVFVGARDLGFPLGVATPVGDLLGEGYFSFQFDYLGSDFQPWLGTVTFNRSTNFFVDTTPETRNDIPASQYDFINTTIHELGHVLGIGSALAYLNQINLAGTAFIGENARRLTSNLGIPVTTDFGHVQTNFTTSASGTPTMTPFSWLGNRLLPTIFDLAIFDDIGYQVNYSAASTNPFLGLSQNQATGRTNLTPGYAKCGCARCLVSASGN